MAVGRSERQEQLIVKMINEVEDYHKGKAVKQVLGRRITGTAVSREVAGVTGAANGGIAEAIPELQSLRGVGNLLYLYLLILLKYFDLYLIVE